MKNPIALFSLLIAIPTLAIAATPPAVDPRLCQALVKHVPDANVNYQPGVDVRGKSVVPADLPGSPTLQVPSSITVPLTADLFSYLHFDPGTLPFKPGTNTAINLGTLEVTGDHVTYNGQPITSDQQDNLAVLCLKPKQ